MRRCPWTVFSIAAAVGVFAVGELQDALIYDRDAILAGELWRMFSGHWVHFTPGHLVLNVLVIATAGIILESRNEPGWPMLIVAAPWIISIGLLVFEPGMQCYGGLSGLATAGVVHAALALCGDRSRWRWGAVVLLSILIGKSVVEYASGKVLLSSIDDVPFVPVPVSHVLGIAAGVAVWIWSRFELRRRCASFRSAKRAVR